MPDPTERDVARQLQAQDIREHARRVAAEAPPLDDVAVHKIARLLSGPRIPTQLMVWQVELLCGHLIEHIQHVDQREVSRYRLFWCERCKDEWVQVSAEQLGLVSERD